MLALQIGTEVSHNELSRSLGISRPTVERYLDLLEKTFIIRKIRAFSGNLRKEINKSCRYYFCDNGLRNAVINNFNYLDMRDDNGMLWENLVVTERLKALDYRGIFSNVYFWRTYDGKELDLVEERGGKLFGFEIKWKKKKPRPPSLWEKTYNGASYSCINRDNYQEFVLGDS
ncbi:MAG: DUF4143 domain-containing protein, partial [Fibrobacterota bacterium]